MNKDLSWDAEVFENVVARLNEIDRVLHLCVQGLNMIHGHPEFVQKAMAYMKSRGKDVEFDEDDWTRRIEISKSNAQFAEEEISRSFPVLHANAAIAIWATLEVLVNDLVVGYLVAEPSLLQNDPLRKVKITVSNFYSLDEQDRLKYVIDQHSRTFGIELRQGASRFESLLEIVGLQGPIDEEIRKTLFELSEVRNVLVHRARIADRRLASACPWLGLKAGDSLQISHERYLSYTHAAHAYVHELMVRVLTVLECITRDEAGARLNRQS